MTAPVDGAAAGAPHHRARLQGRRLAGDDALLRRRSDARALPQCAGRQLRPRRRLALRRHGQGLPPAAPRGSPSSATTRCCCPARTRTRWPAPTAPAPIAYRPALELITGFDINWTIVSYADPRLGASRCSRTMPEDVAVAKLWDAIFAASRVDARRSGRRLGRRTTPRCTRAPRMLNDKRYAALHFRGPGTDLDRRPCRRP